MDIEDSKLIISNSRELIPISNGLVNFQTDFNIVSLEKKPFRAIVVNQESLDNSEEIEMKNVSTGSFSGRIVKDSGKRDEWYIAVESDSQIEAKLSIHTIEIEKTKDDGGASNVKEESFSNHQNHHHEKKKKRLSLWIIALIIGIIGVIGYIVYRFLFKKNKKLSSLSLKQQETEFLDLQKDELPAAEAAIIQKTPEEKPVSIIGNEELRKELIEDEDDNIKLDFSDLPPV